MTLFACTSGLVIGFPVLQSQTLAVAFSQPVTSFSLSGLNAAESTSEFFGSQMRAPLLKRIAEETGGRFYTEANVAALPEDLSITGRGTTVVQENELWDMPVNLLLLVLLVGAEWVYRRRRGLA